MTNKTRPAENAAVSFFVYMLRCVDGSLYTGMARDVEKRLAVHKKGMGSKYVACRLPVEVVYVEGPFETKGDALRREYAIKELRRASKEELVKAASKKNFIK